MTTENKPSSLIKFNKITGQIERPTLLLKTRSGKYIGIIQYTNLQMSLIAKGLDEISFDVHKFVDGKKCEFWDKLRDLCIIDYIGYGQFEADVSISDENETIKSVICKSLETELGQRTIREMHINDEDAITYMTENDKDENGNFIPTVLYDAEDPDHSLLNRVLNEKTPHWSIDYVSPLFQINGKVYEPNMIQRVFTIDGKTPYDFFDSELSEEINCVFTYNTYSRKVSCWNIEECVYNISSREVVEGAYAVASYNEDGNKSYKYYDSKCVLLENQESYGYCEGVGEDTNIFVTKDKLANSFSLDSDKDSIKNCFYVTGGDDVINNIVAAANVTGNNYIYMFANFQYDDMSDELVEKIKDYAVLIEKSGDSFYADGGVYIYNENCHYDETTKTCRDSNNKILTTAIYNESDGHVYVLDTCAYYLVDDNGVGHAYDKDDSELLPTDYIYKDTAGLFTQYCHAQDRYNYLNDSKFPNTDLSVTTAKNEYKKIDNYFADTNNKVVIRNSCSNTSFAHVTSTVETMLDVICDTRYEVNVLSGNDYPKTCGDINTDNPNGEWTGYIEIKRTTDTTDSFISSTPIHINIKYTNSPEDDIEYCNQKIQIAIAKMSIADLDITVDMTVEDLTALFKQYNLTSLNSYCDAFKSCLDVLDDLYVNMDMSDSIISDSYTQAKNLYTNRYETCVSVRNGLQEKVDEVSSAISKLNNDIVEFRKSLDMRNYFANDKLWLEYQSYIREDDYNNANYISDGLTDAELLLKARELLDVANDELKTACTIQKSISGDINNIFAINELESLYDSFALFNYVRCKVDNQIYKLRLMQIDFDENSSEKINVIFSDNIKYVDGTTNDLDSIVSQTQSIATTYSSTTKQAKQGAEAQSTIVDLQNGGVTTDDYKIQSENKEIVNDGKSLLFRQMNDEGVYNPSQMKLTPTGLKLTDDAWENYKAAIGLIEINGKWVYGIDGEAIKTGIIYSKNYKEDENGKVISGMRINLDDGTIETANFTLNEDGSIYATSGIFTGDIDASSWFSDKFSIDKDGNVVAKNISINGGSICIKGANSDEKYFYVDYFDSENEESGYISISPKQIELVKYSDPFHTGSPNTLTLQITPQTINSHNIRNGNYSLTGEDCRCEGNGYSFSGIYSNVEVLQNEMTALNNLIDDVQNDNNELRKEIEVLRDEIATMK